MRLAKRGQEAQVEPTKFQDPDAEYGPLASRTIYESVCVAIDFWRRVCRYVFFLNSFAYSTDFNFSLSSSCDVGTRKSQLKSPNRTFQDRAAARWSQAFLYAVIDEGLETPPKSERGGQDLCCSHSWRYRCGRAFKTRTRIRWFRGGGRCILYFMLLLFCF